IVEQQSTLIGHFSYFIVFAPAWAHCPSCSLVPPEAPTAPTIFPPSIKGIPPSTGTAPGRPSIRRPTPPCATVSWNDFVGRLNRTVGRFFWIDPLPLRVCVPSIFSK